MVLFDASLHVRQVKPPEGAPLPCTRHSHTQARHSLAAVGGTQPLQRARKSGQSFEAVVAYEPATNTPSFVTARDQHSRAQRTHT
jgi:hypothetical protein